MGVLQALDSPNEHLHKLGGPERLGGTWRPLPRSFDMLPGRRPVPEGTSAHVSGAALSPALGLGSI